MKGIVDKTMIEREIVQIEKELSYLEEFRDFTFEQVAKDYKTHHVVERIIEIVVNAAIDINQHLIVSLGKGNLPFDFKESFLLLSDLEIYPRKFAEEISQSAGLRNILVHEYTKLDERKFYNSIKDCYKDYTKYCRYVLDYLAKSVS